MKAFRLPLAFCFFLFTPWATYAQTKNDLIGTWHDKPATSLTISDISSTGQFSGTYSDRTGAAEQTYPILGWINLVAASPKSDKVLPIIFTVRKDAGGSMVVWSGYLSKSKDGTLTIATIWNLVRAEPDPDFYSNQSIVNTAIFKQGANK